MDQWLVVRVFFSISSGNKIPLRNRPNITHIKYNYISRLVSWKISLLVTNGGCCCIKTGYNSLNTARLDSARKAWTPKCIRAIMPEFYPWNFKYMIVRHFDNMAIEKKENVLSQVGITSSVGNDNREQPPPIMESIPLFTLSKKKSSRPKKKKQKHLSEFSIVGKKKHTNNRSNSQKRQYGSH